MKPTLVIMAAGLGSRYGGVKQIEPVGESGQIILEYSIYDAIRAGFDKIVFVIRRDIEQDFSQHIITRFKNSINVEYVFQDLDNLPPGFQVPKERKKPWGTSHAVYMAKDVIASPFAVINADDFYGTDAFRVMGEQLAQTDPESTDFCMVGYTLKNTLSDHGSVARAICRIGAHSFLEGMTEHTKIEKNVDRIISRLADGSEKLLTGKETVSMNMFGFTPRVFPHIRTQLLAFLKEKGSDPKAELYIPELVNSLVAAKTASLRVLHSSASWFGITYREDTAHVVRSIRALVAAGIYPKELWT